MSRPQWLEHLFLRILGLQPGVYVIVLTVGGNGATWRVGSLGKEENNEPRL